MSDARLDASGLVGVKFVKGGTDIARDGGVDCYGLVRLALARVGVSLPEESSMCLAGEDALAIELLPDKALRAGDVVVMSSGCESGDPHLCVCVDAWGVLHTVRGGDSRIDRLAALERTGRIVRRLRPRGLIPKVGGAGHSALGTGG